MCSFLQDYKAEWDPTIYKSVKSGRGPLTPNWKVSEHSQYNYPPHSLNVS